MKTFRIILLICAIIALGFFCCIAQAQVTSLGKPYDQVMRDIGDPVNCTTTQKDGWTTMSHPSYIPSFMIDIYYFYGGRCMCYSILQKWQEKDNIIRVLENGNYKRVSKDIWIGESRKIIWTLRESYINGTQYVVVEAYSYKDEIIENVQAGRMY